MKLKTKISFFILIGFFYAYIYILKLWLKCDLNRNSDKTGDLESYFSDLCLSLSTYQYLFNILETSVILRFHFLHAEDVLNIKLFKDVFCFFWVKLVQPLSTF